jgi:hypothetical protein
MPLDETSPELLEDPDVMVPPVPMPPVLPEPAAPEEEWFDVPPSSPVDVAPVEEHAANPKIATPKGKPAKRIVLFMRRVYRNTKAREKKKVVSKQECHAARHHITCSNSELAVGIEPCYGQMKGSEVNRCGQ